MQAVIFDLDETLILEEDAVRKSFFETCKPIDSRYGISTESFYPVIRQEARRLWHEAPERQYCLNVGISSIEGLWGEFEGDFPNLAVLRDWSPRYRVDSWYHALLRFGIEDGYLAATLAEAFIRNRNKNHIPFDDAEPCLIALSKQYRLGLLTNGAPSIQREKIRSSGIGKYFSHIIVSGEVGYGKPDPRGYREMLSFLKAGPEHTWMVGDSLERDIAGARVAGLKTAWLNRRGKPLDKAIIPDIEIHNLDEFVRSVTGNDAAPAGEVFHEKPF